MYEVRAQSSDQFLVGDCVLWRSNGDSQQRVGDLVGVELDGLFTVRWSDGQESRLPFLELSVLVRADEGEGGEEEDEEEEEEEDEEDSEVTGSSGDWESTEGSSAGEDGEWTTDSGSEAGDGAIGDGSEESEDEEDESSEEGDYFLDSSSETENARTHPQSKRTKAAATATAALETTHRAPRTQAQVRRKISL